MIEKIVGWIVGFGKLQIGFWLLVYEVIIYMLKGKLQSFFKSGLEKRIQLQHNLKKKAKHNKGEEPIIKIRQRFANASDFRVKITQIDAIFGNVTGNVIEQFSYNASNPLFKDKHKLIFPKEIAPLKLDNEIEYQISGAENLVIANPDYKKHAFLIKVEQVIEFATRSTTITIKADDKSVIIEPEDWKGGGL